VTDENPIACSLSPGDLQSRLDEITQLGTESLIAHKTDEDRHLLRFRNNTETRRRLEVLVAAEAQCCPFLDLSLTESDDELILTVVAPK